MGGVIFYSMTEVCALPQSVGSKAVWIGTQQTAKVFGLCRRKGRADLNISHREFEVKS